MFFLFPSIGIQKDFCFLNHWPWYERSSEVPIWNDFKIILFGVAVRFVYVFSSPLPYDTCKKQRTEQSNERGGLSAP